MEPRTNLVRMLSFRRPDGSATERDFIRRYVDSLGARPDGYGNRILRIGDAPVLWSAHTDTVHNKPGRQRVLTYRDTAFTADRDSNCLGADDTTGVYILREMALRKVPGLYIFHRTEESGAVGSRYIARETPELLDGIRYAIAFDRYGKESIITHQSGRRTASDVFAVALADALGIPTLGPDPGGIFTDTETYADMIPECTNVSVGYEGAHGAAESQDLAFANRILAAFLELGERVADLPVGRDHTMPERAWPEIYGDGDGDGDGTRDGDGRGRWHWWDEDESEPDWCAWCQGPILPGDWVHVWDGEDVCNECNARAVEPYLGDLYDSQEG